VGDQSFSFDWDDVGGTLQDWQKMPRAPRQKAWRAMPR
jgi:hypothetical protein